MRLGLISFFVYRGLSRTANFTPPGALVPRSFERIRDIGDVGGPSQPPGATVFYQFGNTSNRCSNRRSGTSHSFDHCVRHALTKRRHYQDIICTDRLENIVRKTLKYYSLLAYSIVVNQAL